ncbi:MAG: TlpA family protein disulfide reductase [Motilibacteraceae bacterium]
MTGVVVLVVALLAATAFGLYRRRTDGRVRSVGAVQAGGAAAGDPAVAVLTETDLGAALGDRFTLLQFSSAFCQPCRVTRVVLADVAGSVPGVAHVELDAEQHLDLVRRLDVLRTPTTFVLDGSGRVVQRAAGAPRKADVLAALGAAAG